MTRIDRFGPEASGLFAALHADCFDRPWPEADFARLLAASGVIGIIIKAGGAPKGLALIRNVAGEGEILTLGIVKTARRSGLGAQLLAAAQEAARKAGSTRLFLEVSDANAAAIGLYRGAGFFDAGRRRSYYRDGSDARVMARKL